MKKKRCRKLSIDNQISLVITLMSFAQMNTNSFMYIQIKCCVRYIEYRFRLVPIFVFWIP